MKLFLRSQQGNAILFVAIILAILAIIGVAAVEFTGRDVGVARLHQREASVQRCTEAARNWILSRFRVGAAQDIPAGSTLQVSLDSDGDSVTLVSGAHIDGTLDAKPRQPPQQLGGAVAPLADRTAVISGSKGLGGGIYTAICRDGTKILADGGGGRAFEVEFAFQANR